MFGFFFFFVYLLYFLKMRKKNISVKKMYIKKKWGLKRALGFAPFVIYAIGNCLRDIFKIVWSYLNFENSFESIAI